MTPLAKSVAVVRPDYANLVILRGWRYPSDLFKLSLPRFHLQINQQQAILVFPFVKML